jgi:hypothetical protein
MLKVIDGQRGALESALIEAICLDPKEVCCELSDRLKKRLRDSRGNRPPAWQTRGG